MNESFCFWYRNACFRLHYVSVDLTNYYVDLSANCSIQLETILFRYKRHSSSSSNEWHVGFPDTPVAPTIYIYSSDRKRNNNMVWKAISHTWPLDFGRRPLKSLYLDVEYRSGVKPRHEVLLQCTPARTWISGISSYPEGRVLETELYFCFFRRENYDSYTALGVANTAFRCPEAEERASTARSPLKSTVWLIILGIMAPIIVSTPNFCDIY